MKTYHFLFLLLLISCHNTDKTVSVKEKPKAQKVPALKTEDASQIIFNFYKEYFGEETGENSLQKYITKQLYDIVTVYEGDNSIFEYNVFIKAQDYDYKILMKTLKVKRAGENFYKADFQLFPDKNAADKYRSITYKLVSEDGRIKIAEVPSDAVLKDLKYVSEEENAQHMKAAMQTAIKFIKYYEQSYSIPALFDPIKGGPDEEDHHPKNYSVDFAEVDKEMSYFRKKGFFTEDFLRKYYDYYKKADENFKKNPMNDGPPQGFEADYFFRTQESFMEDLRGVNQLGFSSVSLNPTKLYLMFSLKCCGNYVWTMKNENGWKIDDVALR